MWKKEKKEDGKFTKVPYQTNGAKAASTRSETWTTFDKAVEALKRFDGIGFVFVEGIIGIDLDHCMETDGTVKPWARDILDIFPSYTERSPSGEGLHIIIESDVPVGGRKLGDIECYATGRFFTVTGNVFDGRSELADCDIAEWFADTFPEKQKVQVGECAVSIKLPDDNTIRSVMFRSKNGDKLKSLYEKGAWKASGYASQSNADLALVSALMFFCCNDKTTVDRIFRASDLMREKWDDHHGKQTYGQMTIDKCFCADTMKWKDRNESVEYLMSGGKEPYPLLVIENIFRALKSDDTQNKRFRLNDFSHMIEVSHKNEWVLLQDYDVLETQRYISVTFPMFMKVSKEVTMDAIRCVAHANKVNPPKEYFEGLVWDGRDRLGIWLSEAFGTPYDELHEKMGSNWLKGLVKRALMPGCQFDEVLVLEGPQGYRKSTSLRVLGSPWHVESTLSTDDKDFYLLLAQNIIVEFSEGDIVGRTSARKLKAIITKTQDSIRPPYEHGNLTYKRGCVFAMTTNDSDYQKDDTGGRRWLPVVLKKVADINWLTANRDQLYAEAVHRVMKLKETTYEYPMEELMALQAGKQEMDEYDEAVQEWYSKLPDRVREEGIKAIDVYHQVIAKDSADVMNRDMTWRVTGILKRALRLECRVVRIGKSTGRRWISCG